MAFACALVKPPTHLWGLVPVQAYDHHALPLLYAHYLSDGESAHRFQGRGRIPTKVNLRHMEKTIPALCPVVGTYLPRVQAKLDAFAVAVQN